MSKLKNILRQLGLYKIAVAINMRLRGFVHRLFRGGLARKNIIVRALINGPLKVHLGCGERIFPGWVNADIYNGDIFLDITQALPFPDKSVDRVYAHHLIEHIELSQFLAFLKELARVCQPRATLRFVTPDLKRLTAAYAHPEINQDLIAHYCQNTLFQHPVEMFNQELRQNGEHRYIYDFDFLKALLNRVGFSGVREEAYNNSKIPELNGLDDHGYTMIDRISLVIEADRD